MWDFKKRDTNSIRKASKKINWGFLFQKKNTHEQVLILNKTLCGFPIFVPNKTGTFYDKDLLLLTQYLKSKQNWYNKVN